MTESNKNQFCIAKYFFIKHVPGSCRGKVSRKITISRLRNLLGREKLHTDSKINFALLRSPIVCLRGCELMRHQSVIVESPISAIGPCRHLFPPGTPCWESPQHENTSF